MLLFGIPNLRRIHMSKKITCLLLAISLSLSISGSALAKEKEIISSDTIITEDNIDEVLKYLGIDANQKVETNQNQFGVKTVKELEDALAQFSAMPKDISCEGTVEKVYSTNSIAADNSFSTNSFPARSVTLLYRLNCDSYEVEYTCSATYEGYYWMSASSANATADTDSLIYVFKVTEKDLEVSIDSTGKDVIMLGTIRVDHYLGIAGYGLINVGHQVIDGIYSWDVSDYAY